MNFVGKSFWLLRLLKFVIIIGDMFHQRFSFFSSVRFFGRAIGALSIILCLSAALATHVLAAAAPEVVTYQGRLLSAAGSPISSAQNMVFLIYDASSNGNLLYTAAGTTGSPGSISVTPSNGLFTVDLGGAGTNALDPTLFRDNTTMYLEVRVGGETLTPRKRLATSPYAFNAKYLDGVGASTNASATYIPVSDANGNFTFNEASSTQFRTSATTTLATATNAPVKIGSLPAYNGTSKLQVYTPDSDMAALISLGTTGVLNFVRSNGGVTFSSKGKIGYGNSNFFANSTANSFNIQGGSTLGPILIGATSNNAPLVVSADDRVGVGTSSPATLFEVAGTSTLAVANITSSSIATLNVGDINVSGNVTGISAGGGDAYLTHNQTLSGLNIFSATTTFATTTAASSTITNLNVSNLNIGGTLTGITLADAYLTHNQTFSGLNTFSAVSTTFQNNAFLALERNTKVQIGTSTLASPAKLVVQNDNSTEIARLVGGSYGFLGFQSEFNPGNSRGAIGYDITGGNFFSNSRAGSFNVAGGSSSILHLGGSMSGFGTMTVTDSRVGIATTTPNSTLSISGTFEVNGDAVFSAISTFATTTAASSTITNLNVSNLNIGGTLTGITLADAYLTHNQTFSGLNTFSAVSTTFQNNAFLALGDTAQVQIGTSTLTNSAKLSLQATASDEIARLIGRTAGGFLDFQSSASPNITRGAMGYDLTGGSFFTNSLAGSFALGANGILQLGASYGGVAAFTMTGDRIGIGTTAPNSNLSINGTFDVNGAAAFSATSTFATTTAASSTITNLNVSNLNIGGTLTGVSVGDAYLTHDQAFSGLNTFSATTTFATTTVASTSVQTANISNLNVGLGLDVSGSTTLHNPLFISGTNGSNFDMGSAGTYFQWIPFKGALRAGVTEVDQFSTSNIGSYSAAFGKNNIVSSVGSFAAGTGNAISGNGSDGFAAGTGNEISGAFGTLGAAFGSGNRITYPTGFAAGTNNHVDGTGTAFGNGNNIDAGVIDGFALGRGSKVHAGGSYSLAAGYIAEVSGETSGAFGENVSSTANNSFVFGKQMLVSGTNSFGVNLANSTHTVLSQANTMAIMGGNMGVGTTTPDYKLTVAGTIGVESGTGRVTLTASNTTSTLTSTVTNAAGSAAFSFQSNTTLTDAVDRSLAVFKNGDGLVKVAISAEGEVAAKGTFHANSTDYGIGDVAENINLVPGTTAEAGDVLVASTVGLMQFEKATTKYASHVAGVITDTGKFVMGAGGKNRAPLALAGLVKVKVTDENGPIKVGDYVVTASKSGYAMKYVPDASFKEVGLVGMALEPLLSGEGKISILVNRAMIAGGESVATVSSSTPVLAQASVPAGNNDLAGVFSALSLVASNGNWKIDVDGSIVAKSLKADTVTAKEFVVNITDNTNPLIGDGVIKKGDRSVVVTNNKVTVVSKIFITFVNNPKVSWWISQKNNGSFEVSLDQLSNEDLHFDYWIVGTVGTPAVVGSLDNQSVSSDSSTPTSSLENAESVSSSMQENMGDLATSTPSVAALLPEDVALNVEFVSSSVIVAPDPSVEIATSSAPAAENGL